MKKNEVFVTQIPGELKRKIGRVCESLGLNKNVVIEDAIREKLSDLVDAHDLHKAIKTASGFRSWNVIRKELK